MLVRGWRKKRRTTHGMCQRWAQRRAQLYQRLHLDWWTALTCPTPSTWVVGAQGCIVPQFPFPSCTLHNPQSRFNLHHLSPKGQKGLVAPSWLTVSPNRAHSLLRWEENRIECQLKDEIHAAEPVIIFISHILPPCQNPSYATSG